MYLKQIWHEDSNQMRNSATVFACSFNSHENYAYWQEWRCV